MMLRLLFLTVLITLSSAGNVTFTDCSNKEVASIDISGCSDSVCSVKLRQEIVISINFVANHDTSRATLAVTAQLGELKLNVPIVDSNACHLTTPVCPLKKGETYTTRITDPSNELTLVAGMRPIITGTLTGDDGVLFCASIPLSIE